ncbi:hypothetical protein CONPUDRAFT_160655 [Coniophora puteana RWD-64-598 SS2]|uniref:Uncharacterized protein n=1 Tax=Coniophora puteana (strain RWD-64-598) TaxID=741705 RepID=R7SDK1_CONPW|nr:uncharacterized protein CONPUDRAFT_160655 [Coniophora puteana RWD-64-598 SS2]EIW73837.1 hypothetical protein CONPUDRAFT_160655 [Coniophora puteana RWD-64-598 SS2]
MDWLVTHEVYNVCQGRKFSNDECPTVEVISAGMESLAFGNTNTVSQFNEQQRRLQTRRRTTPLTGPEAAAHRAIHKSPKPPREAVSTGGNIEDDVDSTNVLVDLEVDVDPAREVGGSVSVGEDEDELETLATELLNVDLLTKTRDSGPELLLASAEDVSFDMDGDFAEEEDDTNNHDWVEPEDALADTDL